MALPSSHPPAAVLEEMLHTASACLGVTYDEWRRFLAVLAPLAQHSPQTYVHSLRVGLYASHLAEHLGLDARMALYGGAAHDLGKVTVPTAVLHTTEFGPAERLSMRGHAHAGHALLESDFAVSAVIAGLHHAFQDDPYGLEPDSVLPGLDPTTRATVLIVARLVADCDYYDALTTRPPRDGLPVDPVKDLAGRVDSGRVAWLIAHDIPRATAHLEA